VGEHYLDRVGGRRFNPARACQLKKLNLIRPLADSKINFGAINVF